MASIQKELASGIIYTAISKYSGIIISLAVAGVLARLIDPEEFGVVAIATVIISFFSIFSDLGIAPAIIQNKHLTEDKLNDIFSFTLWTGIGISILFFLSSWPISLFYKQSSLLSICHLLSFNLFFASANIVPNALLFKDKEFKFIAYRSLFVQCIGGIIAILAAISGAGLYALIINPIFSSILIFIISIRKKPQKLKYTFGSKSIHEIFSYSAYQFMFNVINYFSRNLDKLLIGKYMSMNSLGYYEKSYRLMMLPLQNITALSYEKVIRILAFIGFPLSVLLWFCAKEITLILFGDQWLPSVPVFQILSLSVGIQIILSTSGSIYQAANDTKSLFICGVFSALLNVSGILAGIFIFKSLEAVAWCICATFAINFIQCYVWMYKVTLKRSLASLIRQLISPAPLVGILIVCLWSIHQSSIILPELANLFIKAVIAVLISCIYIQLSGVYNIINFLKSKIKR